VAAVEAVAAGLPSVWGTVVVRLQVEGSSGRVVGLHWCVNTLISLPQSPGVKGLAPWMVVDRVLAAISEQCVGAQFPPSADGGSSTITLPFVFS